MTFKELLEKVESSEAHKKFKKEHPNAILYSAFFMIRQAFGNLILETQQLDYWLGKDNVAMFTLDEKNNIHHKMDILENKEKTFTEMDRDVKIDLDEVQETVRKEIEKKYKITEVSNIILIIQKEHADKKEYQKEGEKESDKSETKKNKQNQENQVWNITAIIGFKMLRMHIECKTGKILMNADSSLFDMMKVQKNPKNATPKNETHETKKTN
jgi:hypothetical protein